MKGSETRVTEKKGERQARIIKRYFKESLERCHESLWPSRRFNLCPVSFAY